VADALILSCVRGTRGVDFLYVGFGPGLDRALDGQEGLAERL
jgi:hypothetical protein